MSAGTQKRVDREIDAEIARFRKQPNPSPAAVDDFEALMNSRGDTLPDDEILTMLRALNETGSIWKEMYAKGE